MLDFWHSDCHRIIMPSRSIGRRMCSRVWYPVEWSAISSERWWINTPPETHECHMSPKKGSILKGKVAGSKHYLFRTEHVRFGLSIRWVVGARGRSDVEIPNFRFWHVYNNAPEKKKKSYHHLTHWKTHTTMHLRRKFVNCHNSMIVISSNWISCYCFPSLVGEDDFMFGLRFPNPFGEKNETKVPFAEAHGQGWP